MQVGRVIWNDYEVHDELGLVSRICCRMEDASRRNFYVQGVKPTAYVPEKEEIPERDYIVDIEEGYTSLFDDDLVKVTTEVPEDVNARDRNDVLANHVSEHFEADIPFYRKTAMKDGLAGYISVPDECETYGGIEVVDLDDINTSPDFQKELPPRVLIGDIEVRVSDEETFKETREGGTQPINVICCYDSYEEMYSVFFYDKHESLTEGSKIREHIQDHWDNERGDDPVELHVSRTEEDMLNEFMNYVVDREFDLTSGWNWIDFDYEYLISRMTTLDDESDDDVDFRRMSPFGDGGYHSNPQMKICGLPAFDMMRAFCDKMTFTNWRSQALDYVANEELDVGKVEDVNINEAWESNAEKLIAYNIIDVQLCTALDEANDIHNFFYEIADESSIPVYDTYYEKRIVDGYVMSRRRKDEVLPSADESELIDNAGGYVVDAVDGVKEDIGVADLKSLYPSDMITWNISTETISPEPPEDEDYVKVPKVPEPKHVSGRIEEEQIEWDWLYCTLEKEGLIPRTLKLLFNKREREKVERSEYEEDTPEYDKWDRKQAATKVIMNSFYGNASSKYWRLSNEYLGDAITSAARYTLWKGEQTIRRIGYDPVYGDTDSHFIQLTEDTIEGQVEELERIASQMDEDASEIASDIGIEGTHPFLEDAGLHGDEYTCMVWEPEKIYAVWMQLGTKKRYAGNVDWKEGTVYPKPKISISGFEFRRSDSMEVTAELQQQIIEMILTRSDFEEVSDYIQGIIDRIDEDYENIKEFALPGSINKPLHEYPNRITPRASMYSNNHLDYDFGEGDDPFVYYVEETPSGLPNTDVVAFEWNEEIPDGFVLDQESIIERGIKKPIDTIIQERDWEFNELRSGKKQKEGDLAGDTSNPFS